jgi:hypothetical protein
MKLESRIAGDVLEDLGEDIHCYVSKIRATPTPPQFKTAHDIATFVSANVGTRSAEPPVCPTVTMFYDLQERLKRFAGDAALEVRPDTLLDDIVPQRDGWKRLEEFLETNLPARIYSEGYCLFFVAALAFQFVILSLTALEQLPFPAIFFISAFLSVVEAGLLGYLLTLMLPRRRAAHLETVGDLACYLALRPDQKRGEGQWSVSEIHQFIRYSVAQSLGESISSIKLRKEYTKLA